MSEPQPERGGASAETVRIGPRPALAVDHMGEGELLLFLHGVGGNKRNWRHNLPAFAATHHAAAWDARGYGESEDGDAPLRFTDFADDVGRVLDHFGAERAHLVGLSMGGRIAAFFHAAAPDRVASLTLCDTHLGFAKFSPAERERFVALRRDPLLQGRTVQDIAPVVAKTLIGDPSNAEALAAFVDSMERLRVERYIETIEASVEQDLEPLFEDVRVPTLVLVGERDRLTPPDLARSIAARIPGAEFTVIAGAGHLPNIEAPAAFEASVLSFLSRI